MNQRQAYLDLQKKHQEEIENFPIAYAFNREQLSEALERIGATSLKECVTVFNHGDIVKKTDAKRLVDLMKNQAKEVKEAMKNEEFAEAAFLYEMDNHEYAINWSGDEDVLACFSMTEEDLDILGLDGAYRRARRKHMEHAQEWGMI